MSLASMSHTSMSLSPAGRRAGAVRAIALTALLAATAVSCSSRFNDSNASSYLIINSLRGASGATPDELGGTFNSDVVTLVKRQVDGQDVSIPTVYEDFGEVKMSLGMKNPSLEASPTNFITLTRYRVNYVRADGRNTPGVDVPYPFDGAMTMTVDDSVQTGVFNIVRIQAKQENPLKPLAGNGGALAISAIAEVTFYGFDQAGRDVSVQGKIGVTFADWGDPN